jgi:hypothetical protein
MTINSIILVMPIKMRREQTHTQRVRLPTKKLLYKKDGIISGVAVTSISTVDADEGRLFNFECAMIAFAAPFGDKKEMGVVGTIDRPAVSPSEERKKR